MIWTSEFASEGGGVIWELQDQYLSGGVYATDNGFISLAIGPQSGSNSVFFGMSHTWSVGTLVPSISFNSDGSTSMTFSISNSTYTWNAEVQKALQ